MQCGVCHQDIPGKVRDLNRHKQDAHPEIRNAMRQKRKARSRRGVSMNYCQSCSKFVSFEPVGPEDQNTEVQEESVTGEVRLILNCAECSQEMHEANDEAETDFELTHLESCSQEESPNVSSPDWSIEESGGGRYSKHIYSASATVVVECPECSVTDEIELQTSGVAASGFDSLM